MGYERQTYLIRTCFFHGVRLDGFIETQCLLALHNDDNIQYNIFYIKLSFMRKLK